MGKILVVDDSLTIVSRLANTIHDMLGFEVIQADSRKTALTRLSAHKDFDMALLDLGLPDAPDGEVVDLVLQYDIPSVILTGNESKTLQKKISQKGIIDYIIKDRSYAIEQAVHMVKRFVNNKRHKVLIVDDSKTFGAKMQMLCERYNLQTVVCSSGEEALELLSQQTDISLMLVDYIMPKMDGLELTTQVRKKYLSHEVAIVALSGASDSEVVPKFLKYGANDFIAKNFSNEEFVARISNVLDALEMFQDCIAKK